MPPNPALRDLEPFIGEWTVEVPQYPGQHGRAVFEWLEGGAFLRFRSEVPDPAPDAMLVISRDDTSEEYTCFHYDARGVSRVYGMSFGRGEWRMWRNVPGFHQRFSGTVAGDGRSIRGAWEKSPDGAAWDHDLELRYTRVA
jgi:hypothetical protein